MEDYYCSRKHANVPAFGSWDWNYDLPFTQCFESARQADLFRYSYSDDRDLYVAGDLYDNHLVTPAMIVVPRRKAKIRESRIKEAADIAMSRPKPKPVDEDLYRISPELLFSKPKKKRGLGLLSSCFISTCVL